MAKVSRVRVSVGATINTGNYENVRPEAEVVMELEPGDKVEEVYEAAWDIAGAQIRKEWLRVKQLVSN